VTTSGGDVALSFVPGESVDAQDAIFVVSGVQISRSSNSVNDVVEGVTLELLSETASPINVAVSRNTDTLKSAIDFTMRRIQSSLQSMVMGGVTDADGNRYSLGVIGLEIDKYSGDLSLDETKFNEAAANDDADLFADLFLKTGTPSDSRVTYVSSSHDTLAGDYDINITGYDGEGNVQGTFTLDGEVYTGVGEGQYLVGPDDSPAENLRIRIASGVTGDLGTLHFTVGVAEQFGTWPTWTTRSPLSRSACLCASGSFTRSSSPRNRRSRLCKARVSLFSNNWEP